LNSPGCFGDFDLNTGLGSPYSPAAASGAIVADASAAEAASTAGAQASARSVGESHVAVVVADTADRSKNKKAAKSKKTSASSANVPSADDNDLEKNLFRAIYRDKCMEIEEALSKLSTLNFVSTYKGYSPLKAAAVSGRMGFINMFLVSRYELHQSDEIELLDFVNNTLQELKKRELTKMEQTKLSSYISIERLLVNDTGGPSSTSRFKYVNTPIVYRIDRTVGCTADLVSASSASACSGGGSETVAVDPEVLAEAERVISEESQAEGLTPVLLAEKILKRAINRHKVSAEASYYLFKKYAQECDTFMDSMQGKTLLELSILKADRYFDSTRLLVQKIVSMGEDHKKRALELLDSLKATKLTNYTKDSSSVSVGIFRCLAKIYQAIHDLDPTRYPNFCFIMNGYFKRDSIMKDTVLRAIKNDLGTSSDAKAASASSFSAESNSLSAAASAGSGGGGGGGSGAAKPKAAKRKLSGDRPVVDAEGNSDENLNKKR
jgi:hypothetical protein